MATMNICFVCLHEDSYINRHNHYESYYELKDHFIDKHTKDYFGDRRDKGSAYGRSKGDMHNPYSKTEFLSWNNNKILGLIDQMIVLENYLDRTINVSRRNAKKRLGFYRSLGQTIIKIMKDYQIPQLMFTKYLKITPTMLEKYTTAYYVSLPDNDKPKWMRAFF
jgi:hypothetical protein